MTSLEGQMERPVDVGVVSTFPPAHCGVGAYAHQQANALAKDGSVARLDITPLQSGGWTIGRAGSLRPWKQAMGQAKRLVVHFQVWMYRDQTRRSKFAKYLWPQLVLLGVLLRHGKRTTMVVHEHRYKLYTGPGDWLQWPLVALLFALPDKLVFHTQAEVAAFQRVFPRRHGIEVRPHDADFVPAVRLSRAEARQRLGLDPTAPLLLAIGFYKVHKGFPAFFDAVDRLVAGGRLPRGLQVHLATSLQDDGDGAARDELARLKTRVQGSAHLYVHDAYLDDAAFDTWLCAADAVALPYLASYSSGVAARAQILGRPLLVRAVGGLAEQAGQTGASYTDDASLEAGLQRLLRSDRTRS